MSLRKQTSGLWKHGLLLTLLFAVYGLFHLRALREPVAAERIEETRELVEMQQ